MHYHHFFIFSSFFLNHHYQHLHALTLRILIYLLFCLPRSSSFWCPHCAPLKRWLSCKSTRRRKRSSDRSSKSTRRRPKRPVMSKFWRTEGRGAGGKFHNALPDVIQGLFIGKNTCCIPSQNENIERSDKIRVVIPLHFLWLYFCFWANLLFMRKLLY